jgi:hypothetical protein
MVSWATPPGWQMSLDVCASRQLPVTSLVHAFLFPWSDVTMFHSGTQVFSEIRQFRLVSIRPRMDGLWVMYCFIVLASIAGFSV